MTIRWLKVWPQYFDALVSGEKTFEFRRDDREPPYAVGDALVLREYNPEGGDFCYTGRRIQRYVTYVARGGVIPEGYCVMSVVPTPAPRSANP